MFGLLNIDKPSGVTSRDAVNNVQRLLPRKTKVGHAGTLDPLANGVLVMCIGKATRLIPYIQQMPKSYLATFRLGAESDTEDIEGQVVARPQDREPSRDDVLAALPKFVGEIMQRPPAYSALKVGGKRAYALARDGVDVELAPRPILIKDLRLVKYEYPDLVLDIECGSGTYVRSLGRDIAESMGTAAVMSELARTGIGAFTKDAAVLTRSLTRESIESALLPAAMAVGSLPSVELNSDELGPIRNGLTIKDRFGLDDDVEEVAALDDAGGLFAILVPKVDSDGRCWRAAKNFSA